MAMSIGAMLRSALFIVPSAISTGSSGSRERVFRGIGEEIPAPQRMSWLD